MKRFGLGLVANQRGSVINIALLILLLLTLLGLAFSRNTVTDIKISGNDRLRQTAFYAADGGATTGARLVEENLACGSGFTPVSGLTYALIDGNIHVDNLTFSTDTNTVANFASPDFYYPATNAITDPGTTLVDVGGKRGYTPGSGLQQEMGYHGPGHGPAGGGGEILYTINSRYIGQGNSRADVTIQWRHVVGLDLECSY